MTAPIVKSDEIEQDRLRQVAEMVSELGEGWVTEYRPGSSGCHELLDRTSLFAEMAERHLLEHPACVANSDWYQLAEQAVAALNELYQRVGAQHLGTEE